MRAVVLNTSNAPLEFIDDHPDPAAGDGLVLDVTACGVCHSDIHVVDGDFGKEPPIVLGHEVTGVHPELGPVMTSIDPASSYFHPGGAALMRKLGTTYPEFKPTLDISSSVLSQHGNIGAASVLWVLHDAWAGGREFADQLRLVALGPGIVATLIHFTGVQHQD